MDKRKKIIILLVVAVLSVYLLINYFGENDRYYLQASGSAVYKIDRKTGKTWLIHGAKEQLVKTENEGLLLKEPLKLLSAAKNILINSYNYWSIKFSPKNSAKPFLDLFADEKE